ncbi:MAG: Rossmann-like and DUF2520 domain-containing protein [Candidatus Tectimicrobiota bacterium]
MTVFGPQTSLGFIGAGAVGGTLAVALRQAGYRVVAVASRSPASARRLADRLPDCTACATPQHVAAASEVVFITTPDDAIGPLASSLTWRPGQGVVHCSGATSLDVFTQPLVQGALPGAFHPFQAVASLEAGLANLPGTTFGIEAAGPMRDFLAQLAQALHGRAVFLTAADKALYHLTAVTMGNLLTGLAATAAQLWEHLGLSREAGVQAVLPMMRSVVHNIETSGIPAALAGPYVRGDVGTIRRHLDTLRSRAPEMLPLYRELALAALPFGVEKQALSPEQSQTIRQMFVHADA